MISTSSTIRLIRAWQVGVLIAAFLLTLGTAPSELAAQSSLDYASGVNFAVPLPTSPQKAVVSEAPPFPGVNITVNSPTAGAQNETTIAINPNSPTNLIGGANDYRTGDSRCGRYFSTNDGSTWTDLGPFPLFTAATDPSNTAFTTAGDPGVAFDANGHAYYLCMYFTRTGPGDNTQFVHKSNDGGATWSPPVQVSSANARSHFDDKGHIAVDNKSFTANRGNVYVAWARLDQAQIRFARSTNGGVSFDPDIVVRTGTVQGANIAVGIDGAVYVAWWELSGANSLINIARSTDGGLTFGAVNTIRTFAGIGPVRPLSRVNSFPVIATDASDANLIYAVWAENPAGNDDSDIGFARSTNGGNTWGAPIRINDDVNPTGDFNSQFFPWMAVDPIDGSINVVWYDDRLDPNHTDNTPLVDLFFASSYDHGLSFSINKRVSTQSSNTTANFGPAPNDFFGDYNAITAYAGVAYPLWTDSRTGDQDVMTTQIAGADLAILKTADRVVVAPGQDLFYTLTIRSNSSNKVTNVVVTDTLPAGVTFLVATDSCVESPRGTLTCSLDDLAAGKTVSFIIKVVVDAHIRDSTTITNMATVTSDQPDPDQTNNTAQVTTIVEKREVHR
jgi:uncharacterized repeat protein (TIGR01451 family)